MSTTTRRTRKTDHHVAVYLFSRGTAAAINLLALAIFTRLLGAEGYGHYLLVAAIAFILYNSLARWAVEALFAKFSEESKDDYVAAAGSLTLGCLVISALILTAFYLAGVLDIHSSLGVFVMVVGLGTYELANELSRIQLNASAVAVATLLRPILIIGFGVLAVLASGYPEALPFAVGAAYLVSVIPQLIRHRSIFAFRWPGEVIAGLVKYGWPVMLAISMTAISENAEKLYLAYLQGAAALGPYGATADMLKQSFFVVTEAVAAALIAIGKSAIREGDHERANAALAEAVRSMFAFVVMGSVAILCVSDILIGVLLAPDFRQIATEILPILLVASGFLVLRSHYFARVIYFTGSSHFLPIASTIQLATKFLILAILAPLYGIYGIALSFALGEFIGCVVFALLGRRLYKMPLPVRDLVVIAILGTILISIHHLLAPVIDTRWVLLAIDLTLLLAAFVYVTWRYELFGAKELSRLALAYTRALVASDKRTNL